METVDLKKIFLKLQKQMIERLSTDREIIRHPGTKGSASELNWREMLDRYLPERYHVDKAFVLDCDGNLSEQIDVVIYDQQYSPFLFHQDNAIYIPAESVYGVFEVKQTINKQIISYAGRKAESVRKLRRTSVPVPYVEGEYKPKKPGHIFGGILSLDSSWKPALGKSFVSALRELDQSKRLDIGCVLQHAGFEVKYEETLIVEKSDHRAALIFFFLKLLERLQKVATVPAIDIAEYGKSLKPSV